MSGEDKILLDYYRGGLGQTFIMIFKEHGQLLFYDRLLQDLIAGTIDSIDYCEFEEFRANEGESIYVLKRREENWWDCSDIIKKGKIVLIAQTVSELEWHRGLLKPLINGMRGHQHMDIGNKIIEISYKEF